MKNLFERTSSHWVRYSAYEWKKDKSGTLYFGPFPKKQTVKSAQKQKES